MLDNLESVGVRHGRRVSLETRVTRCDMLLGGDGWVLKCDASFFTFDWYRIADGMLKRFSASR